MAIDRLYGATGTLAGLPEPSSGRVSTPAADFSGSLARAAEAALAPDAEASEAVARFAAGSGGQIHEALLAVDKAEISLKFMMSVRNRVIEAYREIMRMGM